MTVLWLLVLPLGGEVITPQARAAYERGRQLFEQRKLQEATEAFTALRDDLGLRPLPDFALGNIHATLASSETGAARRDVCVKALRFYRTALDAPPSPLLEAGVIRHNLLLVKRLMNEAPPTGDTDAGNRQSMASANNEPKKTGQPAPDPTSKSPAESGPAIKTAADVGETPAPKGGLGFGRASSLSAEEARKALDSALPRMEKNAKLRRAADQVVRPSRTGDY